MPEYLIFLEYKSNLFDFIVFNLVIFNSMSES